MAMVMERMVECTPLCSTRNGARPRFVPRTVVLHRSMYADKEILLYYYLIKPDTILGKGGKLKPAVV